MKKRRSSNNSNKLSAKFLQKEILKLFIRDPKKRYNSHNILNKLKVKNSKDSIQAVLDKLSNQNAIIHIKDQKYRLNPSQKEKYLKSKSYSSDTLTGRVDMTRSGAAYIITEGKDDDVYVPAKYTLTAMNGDIVEIKAYQDRGKRRPEGKIVKIIKRSVEQIVGRVMIENKYATVHTSYRSSLPEVYVQKRDLNGAVDKDYVVVKITEWSKSQNKAVWGVVDEVLEAYNPSEIAMNSILVNSGFNLSFPEEVLAESNAIEADFNEAEIARRRDFRKISTFTIDPDTAKDFDDALSVKLLDNQNIQIGVHIADVSHYLQPGTALDKEALHRSTSVYLVDRVIPMLPEKLSNNLCSLMPEVDRYTFSAVFTFDPNFKIVDKWFGKGIIHSDKRFAYEDAQEVMDNGSGLFYDELILLNKIAHHLRKARYKNGAIAFDSEEVKFKLDDQNRPVSVYVKERKDTHLLIEDFMLLANKQVAKYIHKKAKGQEIPYIYRTHDEPNIEKLTDFVAFAAEMGFKMDISTPKQLAKSLEKLSQGAKNDDQLKMLEPLAIRTMSKAEYSTDNIGHYGLAFEFYSHFTSPIRRYSDVIAHRLLFKNLDNTYRTSKDKLQEKCNHISQMERKAMKAERESIKFKQVEFLSDKIGEVLNGKVSGFIERGIFIELDESKAEGLVGFDQFNESYTLSPTKLKAIGNRTKHVIKMGSAVQVEILDTNLDLIQIDMKIISFIDEPK